MPDHVRKRCACDMSPALRYAQYAVEGRNYVNFEFAAKSGNFIRRAIAVVTVANGALSPGVRSQSGCSPTI